jgi:RND family efflux transporter MFP subunit
MSKKWLKIVLPVVAIGAAIGIASVIVKSAEKEEEKEIVDTRPTVKIEQLQPQSHQVKIIGHGEVKPVESTLLSAQVSGEVINWHPDFVMGGLVKRGDILFEVEQDDYQAALLMAEANLLSANSQLIEEQGRADVAKREAKSLPDAKVTDLYLRKPQLLSAKAAVKSAQAALKIAQRNLANTQVVAPFDALIVSKDIGLGQFVNTGAKVAELQNIEAAEIMFPIAGFDNPFLPSQVKGLTAKVTHQGQFSYSRDGVVTRDLGLVDSATRMSNIVVRVEDPYSLNSDLPILKFGSYVEVSFNGQTLQNIFRVSQDIVTNNKVWIVDSEQKLNVRNVEVLREEDKSVLIGAGLQPNDQMVVTVPEYPQIGMDVIIAGQEDIAKDKQDEANDDGSKLNVPASANSN